MAIDNKHSQYKKSINDWSMIDNVVSGCDVEQYLVTLNPDDKSVENKNRNDQYQDRAVFYDIAGYTLKGLVSLPFSKPVNQELPERLAYLADNCDGKGTDLSQQAKRSLSEIIKKGRSGLFVTFPETDGQLSKADMDKYFSTVNRIDATQIINWVDITVGSIVTPGLIVIKETVSELIDYEQKPIEQITELYLDDALVYNVRKWRLDKKNDEWVIYSESIPRQADGTVFNEIPFVPIGSEYNSLEVQQPPLLNLCKQNIAHYRNSADYEDSIFYAGQAQPWMSGFTSSHADLLKSNKSYVGSRNLMGVPSGETFGYASAPANPLVRQAMIDKVDVMIGLGARFIKESGQIKTATEVASDQKTSLSNLSAMVDNVNQAYAKALKFVTMFMGVPEQEYEFEISTNFIQPNASAQDIQAIVAGFIQGAIPASDYFRWMKQRDLIDPDKEFEDFSEELNPIGNEFTE